MSWPLDERAPEPTFGLEPKTPALQERCSTIELGRQFSVVPGPFLAALGTLPSDRAVLVHAVDADDPGKVRRAPVEVLHLLRNLGSLHAGTAVRTCFRVDAIQALSLCAHVPAPPIDSIA